MSLPSTEEIAQAQAQAQITTKLPIPTESSDVSARVPEKQRTPVASNTFPSIKLGGLSSTSGKGLILKGVPEKPTLVAKPPGPPTPIKSPWAPLPPIDKVAPVNIDLPQPQPQQQARFGMRDPHGFEAMPPQPAKEIAADDFSRTWREGHTNTSRELYNSQSGRYEPVNDSRRGSSKYDGQSRQPALLQRPSSDQQIEPAGPSAAFQTHRASGQEPSGRRRASSNLSGNSGNFIRRISKGQDSHAPYDAPQGRRGSQVAVSDDHLSQAMSPRLLNTTTAQLPNQQGQLMNGQPADTAHGQMHTVTNSVLVEDDVEYQKKLMRERREQAIKRRLEQEAKDEADKKERIRLKLEAMGPAPESKKAKKDQSSALSAVPLQIQARNTSVPDKLSKNPTAPGDDVETKQPSTTAKYAESAVPTKADNEKSISIDAGSPELLSLTSNEGHSSMQHHWQAGATAASERPLIWAPAAPNGLAVRNVWGPPTSDKTLGNGTFTPELSGMQDLHTPHQSSSTDPGPIGPPGSQSRMNGQFTNRTRESHGQRPAPIGPPSRESPQEIQARQAVAAWGNAPAQLAREDMQARREQNQRDALRAASGSIEPTAITAYKDTWKKVSLAEDGSRTNVQAVLETAAPGTSGSREHWKHTHKHDAGEQLGTSIMTNRNVSATSSPQVRATSRFFPNGNNRDVRLEDAVDPFATMRPGSPCPPPPTMAGHPAYDGDALRPHVSLPKPIVVRLPPSQPLPKAPILAPIAPPRPISFAAAAATPVPQLQPLPPPQPTVSQDTRARSRNNGDWQDRINDLMGRKPSPPKPHALAVVSSSKRALELPITHASATVSLPTHFIGALSVKDTNYETKVMAEECFEEQEMGSLPSVRLPAKAPEAAWHLAGAAKPLHKKFHVHDTTTVEELRLYTQSYLNINLPGMSKVKRVVYSPKSDRQKARGGSSRHASASHGRGGRARDVSNHLPNTSTEQINPGRGRGRGGYGPNWSQRNSAPQLATT